MNNQFDMNELAQRALKNIRALARGNGAEKDAVQIKEIKDDFIQCEAITHLELHSDVSTDQKEGRVQAGQLLNSMGELEKAVQEHKTKSIKNDQVRKAMADSLLERTDKGFALHSEFLDMPTLKRVYSVHQNCGTCQGQGKATCNTCRGKRMEVCNHCHGRGMIPCNHCGGSGVQLDASGNQRPCTYCNGARQMRCPTCQQRGQISCRQCKGSGHSKCNNCKGLGAFTVISTVDLKVKTLFEIDRAALPHPAVKAIENNGSKIVEDKHIQIEGEQVKREDGGLAIQYQVQFPYAIILLSVNGQPMKAELFGYKGKIAKLPAFIETMTGTQAAMIERAARGENVASNITKASKTRIISEALMLDLTHPRKVAFIKLKKRYPLGITNDGLKNLINASHGALKQLTSKSRYGAYTIATILNLIFNLIYFMGGVRDAVLPMVGSSGIFVSDIGLIPLGGALGYAITKFIIRRPLLKALGHLTKKPKLREVGVWQNYALSFGAFIITLGLLLAKGKNLPGWLPL
jgi:hypothetical protein